MDGAHFALVPAAGSGTRFGEAQPKQYLKLAGRTVLEHAVGTLARHPAIECVFVVLAPGDARFSRCEWGTLKDAVTPLYCGGPTRAASVFNALVALRDRVQPHDWMLVHDAARPCLMHAELDRLLREAGGDEVGGLLSLPVADTLKRGDESERSIGTQPRDRLWRALTPQMFRYGLLVEALHRARAGNPTDEAAARRIIDKARDAGINFIDTADVYNEGKSEEIVGRGMKGRRGDWVLATKVANAMGKDPNRVGLSRKWIMAAVDESLARLGTDYIDIYYLHKEDHSTPLAESVRAMGELISQG